MRFEATLTRPGRFFLTITIGMIAIAARGCGENEPPRSGSPADSLPPHISQLLDRGLRPDWSQDGRRLLFLDRLVGDVFEVGLETHAVRKLTGHYSHSGYTRARYLANGDILLCGPPGAVANQAESRRWNAELWVLRTGREEPAVALDEPCFEGPAVSRRTMRIAWTRSDYPERIVLGRSEIWTGEICLSEGRPRLIGKKKVLDRSDLYYLAFLETQDFRPPDERELIFTAYAYRGGEVMGVDLESGEIRNYSQDWGYDEAEGVFPDGRFVAVEREPDTYTATPHGDIDIWRLALDESGLYERLTRFTEFAGFGASNPVVSPDGRRMAFQLRVKGGPHGNGAGIFLYDFERATTSP